MSSNLRIIPSSSHARATNNLSASNKAQLTQPSAPSAPGLPDLIRAGASEGSSAAPALVASAVSPHTHTAPTTSTHPLESRLAGWRATQHDLKMEGLRRQFGAAEPIKRGMELSIVRGGEFRPAVLGGSDGVHGDVLEGRDTTIDWEDVYTGQDGGVEMPGFHVEMEARLKMNQM